MILKQLKMENFRSYKFADIIFSRGQNYFFGRNWQGKTSIMDAIGFALFGKSIFPGRIAGSDVKIEHLVRDGATEGYVELVFEHNGKEYTLHRKCPSNLVELRVDGKILGQTITTVKESLYEHFGLDSKLFSNVFYAEQDELRKILEASPEDRRIFVEMLLGFEYLKDVKMSAKHTCDDLLKFIEEITSGNIKTIIEMIDDVRRQTGEKERFVKNLEQDIKNEIDTYKKFSDSSKKLGESQTKTEKFQNEKTELDTTKKTNEEILKAIKTGKCPTCRQVIPKDLQLKLIHDLREKISELSNKLKIIENEYSKAYAEWSKASLADSTRIASETRLYDLKSTKRMNDDELKRLKLSLDKYEKQYKAFSNKNKIIDIINKEKSFLEEFQLAIEEFRNNLRKSMTKDLENGVNYFMSQFNDEDFDARLKINDEFGFEVMLHEKPVPIFNLSGAARDILALSIRYGLYRIAAKDIDFILFDEPTRHMDSINTYKLKQAFNELKNHQVIIITVHDEFADAEGNKFMIEKDKNFISEIRSLS